MTTTASFVPCDGCGQPASPEHIARRLRRLEWTTRYRPIHIGALLLGAFPPAEDDELLYAGRSPFRGEAARVLDGVGITHADKLPEGVLAEFQKRGFLLTHVMECPVEAVTNHEATIFEQLLENRISAVFSRIRRSLKPKQLVLLSGALGPLATLFAKQDLGCSLLLDNGRPFMLEEREAGGASERLREAIALTLPAAR
jgi:hypothetical protein